MNNSQRKDVTPPHVKEAGHGYFHKGFFLYYKLRNVMRNSDRKRGKYQIKTTAFFQNIFMVTISLLNGFTVLIKWLFLLMLSNFFS